MQQRFGPDVVVQERSCASQLGEREPGPHEPRLVPQEQGHGVPLLQVCMSGQGSGHFVALLVCLAVSVAAVFEQQKLLVRLPRHFVQETIQNAVKRFSLLVFTQLHANFNCSKSII